MKIIFLLFTITINWSRIMVHFCHTSPKGTITAVHCKVGGKLQLCCHPVTTHWWWSLSSPGRLLATIPCISHITGLLCLLCCLPLTALLVGWWCATCARAELAGKNTIHRIHTLAQYTTGLGPPRLHQPDALISFASSIWILILQWQYWCSINKSTSYWK